MTSAPIPRGRRVSQGWTRGGVALLVGVLFAVVLWREPGSRRTVLTVDDLGQLAAATLAAVAAARAAYRSSGTRRRAWLWIAVGMAAWAGGQVVWSFYELVLDQEVPFPSASDIGFLLTPLATAAGLVLWLSAGRRVAGGIRDVLDGAVIAGSLLVLSWVTALGSVYAAGAPDPLSFTLAMAYPIGDVVTATLVLLAVARTSAGARGPLLLLAAGLGGLAAADSAYVYLISEGVYATGNLISSGWVTGFLLIAAAAFQTGAEPAALVTDDDRPSWLRLSLPYLPLVAACGALGVRVVTGHRVSAVETALALSLVVLVLVRQFLVLADNRRLMLALHQREAQLAHQAFHDPLTGLANRALFLDRAEQAVARHRREGTGVAVLFIDLDDFKNVNDRMGHSAGDALLVEVARRLRQALRAVDTVARLGGDEFAALLDANHDEPATVAGRLVEAMQPHASIEGVAVPVGASVGVAYVEQRRDPGEPAQRVTVSELVAAADRAMYMAKAAGKGCAVVTNAADTHRPDRAQQAPDATSSVRPTADDPVPARSSTLRR
ncbi:MAG: hypothetical protein QOI54_1705 [Actinomycetota bacterium]|jgi:diguanylate cyclase (GGDEF)-like protein|nr:hypothetical protein [Actinomycetota bacterium]